MADNNNVSVLEKIDQTQEKVLQEKAVKEDKQTMTPVRAKVEKTVEKSAAKVEKAVEKGAAKVEKTVEQATAKVEETVEQSTAQVEKTVDKNLERVEKVIDEGMHKMEKVAETVFEETKTAFTTGYLKPARPAYLVFLGMVKVSVDTVESWWKKLIEKGEVVEKEGVHLFKREFKPEVKA